DVPVIYMHQFWDTVNKHGSSYRFKIDNKRFDVNVEVFREILNICPRILGAKFLKLKKIHKKSNLAKSSEETPPKKKSIRVKRSAKISPAMSKNKEPAKADTSKGEGTNEGTSTKLGVLDAPKLDSESETESWGNCDKDDDDDDDEASNNDGDINDDDGDDNDDDDDDNDNDSDGDDDVDADEQKEEEKENVDERVLTPEDSEFSDEEDHEKEKNEEKEDDYEELYRDVNVNLRIEDVDMTNVDQGGAKHNVSQESRFEHEEEDAHLLNFDNVSPADNIIASVMDTTIHQTSFDQRVSSLEQEVSQFKQADNSAQVLESIKLQIPAIVDDHLSTRLRFAVQMAFQSYKAEFEKEAQAKQDRFIEIIDKSIKEMVKDEVKNLLLKEISDFATLLIESTIAESYENVKILLDKMQKSKSYQVTPEHKELYDGLVKSYNVDKSLFEAYGNTYSLKRDHVDKDKDEDPSAGSDRGSKRRKTSKDAESSKEPKSMDLSVQKDQEFETGINDNQSHDEAASKQDNMLMHLDELYKFCDGMLNSVRSVLHDIANNLRMEYLPKRYWSRLDKTRSCIMIKAIDEMLFERRLMRNLERFVGGREYGNDFRLLERTI
ncbi:hypothetical protein Tco_1116438, partial [Tanacetum coccineum]